MITPITTTPKIVPSGTWRLLRVNGKDRISNDDNLMAGPKSLVWTGDTKEELEAKSTADAAAADAQPEQG